MPTVTYSESEYFELLEKYQICKSRLQSLEKLQPLWGIDAQVNAVALTQIWNALGVTNQTDCMRAIRFHTIPLGDNHGT